MASVLGTSRGSGGLSSQLRCKSKRRRRRRSKRKGKDLVFGAERLLLTLLSLPRSSGLWALPVSSGFPLGYGVVSAQGRVLGSSGPFVSDWGRWRGFCQPTRDSEQSSRLRKALSRGRWERGRGRGKGCSFSWRMVRSLVTPGHQPCLWPSRRQFSTRCQRKRSLKPASLKTRYKTSCQLFHPNCLGGRSGQNPGSYLSKLAHTFLLSAVPIVCKH